MLSIFFTLLHIVVAVFLILVVLLQTGKRADLAGAFGGGGSQTAFGARGAATLLTKLTTAAAVMFMVTSLGLSIVAVRDQREAGTVLGADEPTQSAPAVPGAASEQPADVPAPEELGESSVDDPVPPETP